MTGNFFGQTALTKVALHSSHNYSCIISHIYKYDKIHKSGRKELKKYNSKKILLYCKQYTLNTKQKSLINKLIWFFNINKLIFLLLWGILLYQLYGKLFPCWNFFVLDKKIKKIKNHVAVKFFLVHHTYKDIE